MTPRRLGLSDIPAAMELSLEARWNQTSDDWRLVIERDRDRCFALEIEDELAATTTLVSYGDRLGWIGMVLTRERFRRRGCARALLQHAIDVAAAKGLRTLKLDATDAGAPLYASLEFVEEQPVERWFAEGAPPFQALDEMRAPDEAMRCEIPEQLDTQAFGADRASLLSSLVLRGTCTASHAAYALTRPGRMARYMGPCVASNRDAAKDAIGRALSDGGSWYWDLMPSNAAAVDLARWFGFSCVRRLRRMRLGETLRGCDDQVFALGGFELG